MDKLIENTRRPDISFCRSGRIMITARVADILDIHPGDSINISAGNGEYLLHAVRHLNSLGRHVAQCYPTNRRSRNFCANSVRLCRAILSAAGVNSARAAFITGEPIKHDSITYLPIITKHPLTWTAK